MLERRPRLLFVCLGFTSFVKDDLKLLRERYDVRVFRFDAEADSAGGRALKLAAEAIRQLFWLLRELPQADLVYGWFADYHVALPVLLARRFGVPVAVPLAGFDAIRLPALGYGVYDSTWRAPLARWIVRKASLLLPVSETMIWSENRYSEHPKTLQNGVRAHVPDLSTPHQVVPFGYDPDEWSPGPAERSREVLSVGMIDNERTLRRKGIDLLIEAARRLPEVRFRVIGISEKQARACRAAYDPPGNVELLPPRPRAELVAAYQRASVYAQLSRAEGMPNVLGEAMCCGCIPVGSAVFGIPETIGDTGCVVETPDPDAIAEALRGALDAATPARREAARRRITEHFSTERRRERLHAVLDLLRQRS